MRVSRDWGQEGIKGQHWALYWKPALAVNIPVGRHKIIVAAMGRLDRWGRMRRWQVGVEVKQLYYCCGRGEAGE